MSQHAHAMLKGSARTWLRLALALLAGSAFWVALAGEARGSAEATGASPAARAAACVPARSVSVIIDDSSSMEDNDPAGIRRRATELLITKPTGQGRTMGAVEFGSQAAPLFAPGVVSSDRPGMLAALGALADDGADDEAYTNYNAAFEVSRDSHPGETRQRGGRPARADRGRDRRQVLPAQAQAKRRHLRPARPAAAGGQQDPTRDG